MDRRNFLKTSGSLLGSGKLPIGVLPDLFQDQIPPVNLKYDMLPKDYVECMAKRAMFLFKRPQSLFPTLRHLVAQGRAAEVAYQVYDQACLNGRLDEVACFLATDIRDRVLLIRDKRFVSRLAEEFLPAPGASSHRHTISDLAQHIPIFDLLSDRELESYILGDMEYCDTVMNRFLPLADSSDQRRLRDYFTRRFDKHPPPTGISDREKIFHMVESRHCYFEGRPTFYFVRDYAALGKYMMQQFGHQIAAIKHLINCVTGQPIDEFLSNASPLGPHTQESNAPFHHQMSRHLCETMRVTNPRDFVDFVRQTAALPQRFGWLAQFCAQFVASDGKVVQDAVTSKGFSYSAFPDESAARPEIKQSTKTEMAIPI